MSTQETIQNVMVTISQLISIPELLVKKEKNVHEATRKHSHNRFLIQFKF